ncbi:MAG: T9SS type A sorting domain-containing protein [Bacteroidota bacterium]
MKRILLLIFLMIAFNSNAQYHPMLRPGMKWDVMHGDGTILCFYYSGEEYYLDGDDTLITGTIYQLMKVYTVQSVLANPWCGPYYVDTTMTGIFAYLREDTTEQRVYRYFPADSSEKILYDFSLQQGDTFVTVINGPAPIDTTFNVTLLDGSQRKALYLNGGNFFIESIGGTNGPLDYLITGLGFWDALQCASENNIQLWGYTVCLPTSGINETTATNIKIYPNPVADILEIQGLKNKSTITISDLTGRMVKATTVENDKVSVVDLQEGMYIYCVADGDFKAAGKFLICR